MTTRNSDHRFPLSAAAVVAALLLAALLMGGGQQAFAHAGYEESTPADGETVSESPERVDVFFGQEIARQGGLPTMIVVNVFGDIIADEPVLDDTNRKHVYVDLPAAMGTGRYTVIWHTLSDEDGEEAQGAFHFFVGEVTGETTPATATPAAATVSPALTIIDGGGEDGGSDVPLWALIGGLAASLAVGLGVGVALAARRPDSD
ncbi:MAG TPA: copper resistance protein CopC [Dehalococcoidia bacterium]